MLTFASSAAAFDALKGAAFSQDVIINGERWKASPSPRGLALRLLDRSARDAGRRCWECGNLRPAAPADEGWRRNDSRHWCCSALCAAEYDEHYERGRSGRDKGE